MCKPCTFWVISSPTSKKIWTFILRLYTLFKYHEIKPVTLNTIHVLHTKFESLCHLKPFLICFLKATRIGAFFFRFHILPKHLGLLWTWQWRYVHPTYGTFKPLSPIQMHDISIFGWQCSMWRLRKGNCEVHFVFISSPLEKDELNYELQKAQLRSKSHYTNCMQVWLGLHRWYQREPRVSKYTHNTHLTQGRGKILIEQVSVISKIMFFCVLYLWKKCVCHDLPFSIFSLKSEYLNPRKLIA